MDAGEIQKPESSNIIEFPENYDEMIKKLQEREEEQLKKILEKRKAETFQELKEIATKRIVKRMSRVSDSGEYKALKDRTIYTEAKSEEIVKLKNQLNDEIKAVAHRIFEEIPKDLLPSLEKKVTGLQGRVQKGVIPSSDEFGKSTES